MSARRMRSCGRVGPAIDGSTVARSSSIVAVYRASGVAGSWNIPCSRQYASTRAICSSDRPVWRRYRSVSASTGKIPHVAPYSGAMLAIVARSASGRSASPSPKNSTNFPTTPLAPEHLGDREDEVGGRRPPGQPAGQAEPDDLRDEHTHRLAEHGRLGLDPADAPPEHAQPVDHRRVAVGPDQGVRVGHVLVVDEHDPGQVLDVHLVDDPGLGRDDFEVVERGRPPPQEGVPLLVPLVLELGVPGERQGVAVVVDLDRVVDDEFARDLRVDLLGVPAEGRDPVPHGRQVDHARDAGEVLEEHPGRRVRDLGRRLGVRVPPGQGLDVGLGHGQAVLVPDQVFQQDLERERQRPGVRVFLLDRGQAEDRVRLAADGQVGSGTKAVRHRGRPFRKARRVATAIVGTRDGGDKEQDRRGCNLGPSRRPGFPGEADTSARLARRVSKGFWRAFR